jgi:GNAT superfamily N-acetyltransferase
MPTPVTVTYLELTGREQFRPSRAAPENVVVAQVSPPLPELNRFFYTAVGGDWYWIDRLPWTYHQWLVYLTTPGVETWLLSVAGVPAGFFELQAEGESVEIVYFGLLPAFVGRGLGGYLLSFAIERAWTLGPRVWLHTCNLDHPQALASYQARGFRIYKQETQVEDLPAVSPGLWAGCRPATAAALPLLD